MEIFLPPDEEKTKRWKEDNKEIEYHLDLELRKKKKGIKHTYYENFRNDIQSLLLYSKKHLIFQGTHLIQYINNLCTNNRQYKLFVVNGNWETCLYP